MTDHSSPAPAPEQLDVAALLPDGTAPMTVVELLPFLTPEGKVHLDNAALRLHLARAAEREQAQAATIEQLRRELSDADDPADVAGDDPAAS